MFSFDKHILRLVRKMKVVKKVEKGRKGRKGRRDKQKPPRNVVKKRKPLQFTLYADACSEWRERSAMWDEDTWPLKYSLI